ncbi:MAG TPA: dihydrofolate reductase [Candidatus Nanoarchaeia archaeon]|nr:dihydrofolate reductase [Candidatus Nanoarchaeia archaeon]
MIALISAMTAQNHVIGKNNRLPWNIPEEMAVFQKHTKDSVVIMGRKTFESIGKTLPKRVNIVVSSSMPKSQGIIVCRTIEEALAKAKEFKKDIFIIGGAQIYELGLPYADKMFLSLIKKEYVGDACFPDFGEKDWKVEKEEDHAEFTFRIYAKK